MARETATMVTLTCEHCKREFRLQQGHYDSRTRAAGHPPKYCSRFCMGAANRVPEVLRVCQHCGEEFMYQPGRRATGAPRRRGKKFCSKECQLAALSASAVDPELPGYTKGRRRNADGYILRRPIADRDRSIKEHVVVMERHLGRSLFRNELVHHKNGDRADNTPPPDGNLELWDTSHPPGQRVSDKVEFCKEFLSRYGYVVIKPVGFYDNDVMESACLQ